MGNTSPPQIDEALIASRVQSELSRRLVERVVDSTYIAPLGIALVAWVIFLAVGWKPALLWSGMLLCIELLIVWLGRGFRRTEARNDRPDGWRDAVIAASGLLGLGWGSCVWFVWAEDAFLLYLATLIILVGVSATCMVTMSPVRRAHGWFVAGLLAPMLGHLGATSNPLALQIGIGFVVMAAVQVLTTRDIHSELVREVDSSLRNKELLELLSKASADLHHLNGLMEEKNVALGSAMDTLREMVTQDHLTGAYSRRYVFEQLERIASTKQRHGTAAAIIMFDLDHFKAINDTYGHPAGDRVLQEVVRVVGSQLRDGDMLARVGGEEFLALLPFTDISAALMLAERLRLALDDARVLENGTAVRMPASFGVAELMANEGYNDWFRRADAALYQAKAAGRNSVEAAH